MYELKENRITPTERIAAIFASIGQFMLSLLETIIIALTVSTVLYLFVMTGEQVIGSSMYPTYKDGEYILASKITYELSTPKRGDVIIFKYSDTQDFIKRVIGLPGDQIMLKDGHFYINGNELDESGYLDSSVYTSGGDYLHEGETITIPANEYFVCGDNREHSFDSRFFGPIQKSAIKGKSWAIYYPLNDFKLTESQSYKN